MRFPPSLLDEIRARLPISAVVGRRVTWDRRKSQPSRGDFWACCPFHGEKTPSFHADDRKGRYHCFGCSASGDHFTFLTELEGLSFPEAVERLATEAGLPLPAADPRAAEEEKRRASIYEVLETAALFFEANLRSRDGAPGRLYLARRGIGPEAQTQFRLGYASPARNALKEHLAAKGVAQDQMAEAGLIVVGEDIAVSFDRFRDRVIFPIADLRGRVVGFGGRAMSADAQAKYLNSPETPVFRKGALLYNAAEAGKAARQAGAVVAVEGYTDVIAMVSAGFAHTVAPLGTALTEPQLQLLWRMAPEPILCFDGDAAGMKAADRAIDLALGLVKPGFSLRFALLPEGRDPDDLIAAAGSEAMAGVLSGARPLVEMIWSRETRAGTFDTPERRAALEQRLAELARAIPDSAVRRHYEHALRERAGQFFTSSHRPRPASRRYAKRFGAGREDRLRTAPAAVSDLLRRSLAAGAASPPLREAVLVVTMAHHPALLAEHLDDFGSLELTHRPLDSLRRELLELAGKEPGADARDLQARLTERGFGPALARLTAQVERSGHRQALAEADDREAERGWLQASTLHRRARTLHKELRQAEAALAVDPSDENLARMVEIQKQLAKAGGAEAADEGFGSPSGPRK